MSVRMLRITSRRSAPSKLSDTAGPDAAAPAGAGGRPPPGNWPLTNWPVPLNSFACSAPAVSGVGPVILIEPCIGLAGFDHGGAPSRSGLVVQPPASRITARPCNDALRSLGMRGFLGAIIRARRGLSQQQSAAGIIW